MPARDIHRPNDLARQLLAFETTKPSASKASPVFLVFVKMRGPLATVLGVEGFRSLVSRAHALACSEMEWLRNVAVESDGSLRGEEKARADLDGAAIKAGEVALVAELLGLLFIFIGPQLTEQLLRTIWPKVRPAK